ncbi:ABC transporter permease [Bowmanella sp. Y26]|uniref:ABC transporter permease n=1 Tax=Bowmanella yangjiangensis TaxID=2811230 RepID=UPI001BDD36FD|nr:ABC transporter permease [Bowmanella yangjiangensis]MBT1063568.1 ABC transporter permease [Bowmanella yangjiangensis]
MFNYYLRLALLSIRRNPILSVLMVAAIALGIGASMTTITVNYLMSANPIPQKSEQLYYVQVDSWDPNEPAEEPNEPPDQLTWTDANNLYAAQKAERQVIMATTAAVVEPPSQDAKPFNAYIRLTTNEFFPMFDVPFLYGGHWQASADKGREQVVVLSRKSNDKIFGGENSVGRSLRLAGRQFTVVGVLESWYPAPKFYDVGTGAFEEPEDLYIPFLLKEELQLPNGGNTNCWKTPEDDSFAGFLRSECINYQMWVELPDEQDKQAYLAFLNNYANEQKALGRFPRPLNNRLSDVMQWMENRQVVTDDARVMLWLSLMFLVVCLLNTVGLLLAKFSGKSAEIGLRRAIGASRQALFYQHLVETACIGLTGGIAGLALAYLGLLGIGSLYGSFANNLTSLDINMVLLALLLSLISSIAAGLYPTWRACSIAPASQLKSQ